jgi:hypothetical protein
MEASIPKSWYKAGDTIPITLTMTPSGYKKVTPLLLGELTKVGWIKATLINRVTIHGKQGSKEVTLDYALTDTKIDDDTDFAPDEINKTVKLGLVIPVPSPLSFANVRKRYERCRRRYLM